MHAGASIYDLPFAFAIEGPLEVSAMQRSLRELVVRHEALRRRMIEDDLAQPQLQYDRGAELDVPVVDAESNLLEQP